MTKTNATRAAAALHTAYPAATVTTEIAVHHMEALPEVDQDWAVTLTTPMCSYRTRDLPEALAYAGGATDLFSRPGF